MDSPLVEPLKTGRHSKSDPNILFCFFDTILLSANIESVSISRMRDFIHKIFKRIVIFIKHFLIILKASIFPHFSDICSLSLEILL